VPPLRARQQASNFATAANAWFPNPYPGTQKVTKIAVLIRTEISGVVAKVGRVGGCKEA